MPHVPRSRVHAILARVLAPLPSPPRLRCRAATVCAVATPAGGCGSRRAGPPPGLLLAALAGSAHQRSIQRCGGGDGGLLNSRDSLREAGTRAASSLVGGAVTPQREGNGSTEMKCVRAALHCKEAVAAGAVVLVRLCCNGAQVEGSGGGGCARIAQRWRRAAGARLKAAARPP